MRPPSITNHCADRYVERVKDWLTREEARAEILRLAVGVEPTGHCDYVEEGEHFDAFIELAPGISLGCRWTGDSEDGRLTAVTTMVRTGRNKADKASRRHQKKVRRIKSRAQKRREQLARRGGLNRRLGDEEWRNE